MHKKLIQKLSIICGYTPSLLNFRRDLLISLRSTGLQVTAYGPQNDNETEKVLSKINIHFVKYNLNSTGLNPLSDIGTLMYFIKKFRLNRPLIIFSYTIKAVIYASIAARLTKIPKRYALITGLGSAFEETTFKLKLTSFIAKVLYRIALKNATSVFFQNIDDESFFRKNNIISAKTKSVIINGSGINLDDYKFSKLKSKKEISFLLVARLLKNKGIIEFVNAAKLLKHKYKNLSFNILGFFYENPNGVSKSEMKIWQRDGYINYLGSTNDVKPYLIECSVFTLPSFYKEGTPRTVLEAMATGRPIITTDTPGCRETVIDGENGFLVKPRDVHSLVEAMEKFIQNPEIIPKMGKRSREIAEEKYNVHKVNAVILDAMGLKPMEQ